MCFSLAFIEQLLVWIVIIVAIFAILKLLLTFVTGQPFLPLFAWPGIGGIINLIVTALLIVFWAFVAIFLIYFLFDLIQCLLSTAGGFPRLRH